MINTRNLNLKLNKAIFIFIILILITTSLIPSLANGQSCDPEECEKSGGTCQFDDSFERNYICVTTPTKSPTITGQPTGGQAFGEIPSGGSGRTQTIRIPNPLQAKSFQELIQRVVNWLLVIGAPILVLMIIIGAFQIMTGAGNPENITKGRHTITYAVIGYALLLISNGIILIIKQLLGVQ